MLLSRPQVLERLSESRPPKLERFVADAELMVDVASLGVDFFIAEMMFRGVRTGGGPVSLPFSWGFGRI